MPRLTLTPPGGGQPVSVTVDDSFAGLSPAAQNQTVDEIASHIFSTEAQNSGSLMAPAAPSTHNQRPPLSSFNQ